MATAMVARSLGSRAAGRHDRGQKLRSGAPARSVSRGVVGAEQRLCVCASQAAATQPMQAEVVPLAHEPGWARGWVSLCHRPVGPTTAGCGILVFVSKIYGGRAAGRLFILFDCVLMTKQRELLYFSRLKYINHLRRRPGSLDLHPRVRSVLCCFSVADNKTGPQMNHQSSYRARQTLTGARSDTRYIK